MFHHTPTYRMALDGKRFFRSLLITALFNTVIALFLTHLGYGGTFLVNLVFSQSIGLSICTFILGAHLLFKNLTALKHFFLILVSMILGAGFGSLVAFFLAGLPLQEMFQGKPTLLLQTLGIGILFGSIITYFFFSQERISQAREKIQEERIRRLDLEKRTLETHLRMLQAQVEPHFLFNTLSTVLALMEADRKKASQMLNDLIRFLRASLSKSRGERTTIGEEMKMVRAYLKIHQIRMGERLRYEMSVAHGVENETIPPMLIQPLVENAIKHGLEPSLAGGIITITVRKDHHLITITVADTGRGFDEKGNGGFGLQSVRERLNTLYGSGGRLILAENRPFGVKATIEIPE